MKTYPCGCTASPDNVPDYCPEHGSAPGLALALRFHEAYERLAPSFGYETRKETRAFDPESPNGRLMIAVCSEIGATGPLAAPQPIPCACTTYCRHAGYPDAPLARGYICRERAAQPPGLCQCVPLAPRNWNYCQDCGGKIARENRGDYSTATKSGDANEVR